MCNIIIIIIIIIRRRSPARLPPPAPPRVSSTERVYYATIVAFYNPFVVNCRVVRTVPTYYYYVMTRWPTSDDRTHHVRIMERRRLHSRVPLYGLCDFRSGRAAGSVVRRLVCVEKSFWSRLLYYDCQLGIFSPVTILPGRGFVDFNNYRFHTKARRHTARFWMIRRRREFFISASIKSSRIDV